MAPSSHWARTYIACLWPVQAHSWQSPDKEPALSTGRMICAKSSLGNRCKKMFSPLATSCPLCRVAWFICVWCEHVLLGSVPCFVTQHGCLTLWQWMLRALSLADTRAASDQLLLKDSYLSLEIYLPDFMGNGDSNKYEAIKVHKVNQCLLLLIFPCWLSWSFVITFSGENLWMLEIQNIAGYSGALI